MFFPTQGHCDFPQNLQTRNSTLNRTTTASFHIVFDSLINHPIIRCSPVWAAISIFNETTSTTGHIWCCAVLSTVQVVWAVSVRPWSPLLVSHTLLRGRSLSPNGSDRRPRRHVFSDSLHPHSMFKLACFRPCSNSFLLFPSVYLLLYSTTVL
jgi:hypothetical protein